MKGNDATWTGIVLDIADYVGSRKAIAIIACDEIPHNDPKTVSDVAILLGLHPAVWRTEEGKFILGG